MLTDSSSELAPCTNLIVRCLSACVRRVSREALNQAHNDSIHWRLCVTQHLQWLIPRVGFSIQPLLSPNLLLMNLLIISVETQKGDGGKAPRKFGSTGGQFESERRRRDQAGANRLNFFTTFLQTNRKKEKRSHGRHDSYLLPDERSGPVREAP